MTQTLAMGGPTTAASPLAESKGGCLTAATRKADAGVDAVVHLASATQRGANSDDVGVAGTRRLVAAGRQAGVRHLVYISIVGTDRVQLGYYRRKLAAGTTRRPGIGSRHGAAAGGCCRSR
jgi:nucleoside-diphosphate-sugar epimerase